MTGLRVDRIAVVAGIVMGLTVVVICRLINGAESAVIGGALMAAAFGSSMVTLHRANRAS